MPRNTKRRRRPDAAPFDLRREAALSILPPAVAGTATAAVFGLVYFWDPLPAWAGVIVLAAVAALAVSVIGSIAMCFLGRSRRLWKAAVVFPVAIIVGAIVLVPAFERFALVHHGVDTECVVTAKHDFVKTIDGEEEPMTAHDLLCRGQEPVSIDTDRDEQLELSEVRIVVFDPLGRVDPDFGDPSAAEGLSFVLLSVLFLSGGVAARLFLVDDGTIVDAVSAGLGRLGRRLAA
ncbi:hypothetical protein [Glycomyces harbinensis]|uniref:Uncharacterized protein n=1 Tax=Glycomyces harbinensis TaxID=58114 RepID=A0A1G6RUQ9_9ACTN|nr:hypothetical protein [Glycomyces harbinensis]SDD08410.1 hypothetical protein SAMN05216270_101681 [Glycomyces harbinensis]